MPIVTISETLLQRTRVADKRILRDRVLCGFCVRLNARKRAIRVITSVLGKPLFRQSWLPLPCQRFVKRIFPIATLSAQSAHEST